MHNIRMTQSGRAARKTLLSALLAGASMTMMASLPGHALAQTASAPTDNSLGDIVVTARKRDESLLNVPVTVSAFTAATIAEKGIIDLQGIADFTPGVKLDNVSNSREDRSNQTIIIRGMTPNSYGNVSVFIDGAPVTGSGFVTGIDDLQRVEVLKGPQSATFGRATFAGAVNLVTRDPTNDYHASIDATVASYNGYDIKGSFEGAIVPDKLTFLLQARDFSTDGSYKNYANTEETLGAEGTKSVDLKLKFTPIEKLTVKFFGVYWEDNDGPGTTGILDQKYWNCAAGANGAALNYTCGQLPKLPLTSLQSNADFDAATKNQLLHNSTGAFDYINKLDFADHFGLTRKAYHMNVNIDYELPQIDAVLTSVSSYDADRWRELIDLDNTDSTNMPNPLYSPAAYGVLESYVNWPSYVDEDIHGYSEEVRLHGGDHGPFHWAVGGSYVEQWYAFSVGALLDFGAVNFQTPTATETETAGGFLSLGYDVTNQITVSFDGRYENEKQTLYNLLGPKTAQATESFNNFVPRVNIQYKPIKDLMIYATYSQGVNPGAFNSNLVGFTPAQSAAITAKYNAQLNVAPEKLTNYELGVKGKFFDNHLQVTADVYHDIWTNEIVENDVTVTGIAGVLAGEQLQISENVGQTDLTGVELDGSFTPYPGLTFDGGVAYTPSDIKKYNCTICALSVTGNPNVNGNQLAGTPAVSSNLGVEYKHPLVGEYDGYARLDWTYQGKIFEDETNLAWIAPSSKVNVRAGVTRGKMSFEGYITNLFDDTSYVDAQRNEDLLENSSNAAIVGLPARRTFGLRFRDAF